MTRLSCGLTFFIGLGILSAGAPLALGQQLGGPREGHSRPVALVPDYWLADAAVFLASSVDAATVMEHELELKVQAPRVIGRQAAFLAQAAARALNDVDALERNAMATHPAAVPALRETLAQLIAAQAVAEQLAAVAGKGQMGPTYAVTLRSALAHLQFAQRSLIAVGQAYGLPQLASVGRTETAPGWGRAPADVNLRPLGSVPAGAARPAPIHLNGWGR